LLEDHAAGKLTPGEGDLEQVLMDRGLPFVEYAGWQAIDAHERSLGEPHGRPRVKLVTWDELLGRGTTR
jgi:ferredoxin--NADP+ reductase